MADKIEDKVKRSSSSSSRSLPKGQARGVVRGGLKADSLAVVELVLALEEAFKIEIPDEDTEKIKTVGDAINYIKAHAK